MRFARRDLVATNNHTLRDKTGAYGALLFGFVCLLCFLFAQTRPGCPRVRRFTQRVMAAVAGDAENINKQARNTRTNWLNSPERANWVNDVKNKQAADVLLPSAPVGGAHAA